MKLALVLIASVLIAGCASQTEQPPAQPSFRILSPAEGQVSLDNDVTISLQTENVIIASPTGQVIPNQGHFHFFLDNSNEEITTAAIFTYHNVTLGQHTIRIELHRGDHSPFIPAVIKSVSFTIVGEPLPPPPSPPVNTTSPPPPVQPVKEFNVTAQQFSFSPDTITVSKGDKVIINAISEDVNHGLSIPAYGVDLVLVLNQTKTVTFTADKTGEFTFFCSVACGSGHGGMTGKLVVNP